MQVPASSRHELRSAGGVGRSRVRRDGRDSTLWVVLGQVPLRVFGTPFKDLVGFFRLKTDDKFLTVSHPTNSNAGREERSEMKRLTNLVWKLRIWKDTRGQDLIEYALMAGFVAVAAGAIMPGVASSISTIFSKINAVMVSAAAQG